jgi:hypothetical protein
VASVRNQSSQTPENAQKSSTIVRGRIRPSPYSTSISTTLANDLKLERQHAHELLDLLPDEKLRAVHSLLEGMIEPLSRSLSQAPTEEEDLTPETAQALEKARASLRRGEGIPHDEILREFGLKK